MRVLLLLFHLISSSRRYCLVLKNAQRVCSVHELTNPVAHKFTYEANISLIRELIKRIDV